MPSPNRTAYPQTNPAWFATAAQKVRAKSGHPRHGALVPWGTVHGRRLGAARTACGVACLTWPIFFDVDMHGERSLDICAECRRLTFLDRPPLQ